MKIVPKAVTAPTSSYNPAAGKASPSTREAAINALLGNQAQQAGSPQVRDQTRVSPEETSAVRPPSQVQNNTNETPVSQEAGSEQPQATEVPVTETVSDQEKPLSSQYAQLARREKALRLQAQQLKQSKAAFEAEKAKGLNTPSQQPAFDESKYIAKDKLSQDPLTTLLQAGVSYDQITQLMLNQPQVDPGTRSMIDELKAEIKALRGETDGVKKTYENQQAESYKQAVNQIRLETKNLIESDSSFEAIKATSSVNDVVDLIEQTFKSEGYLMSVEEAAREVEEYLIEEATKLSRLSKIQKRLQSSAATSKAPQSLPQQTQAKTLTNALGTQKPLSAKERALLAFKGQLK